MPTFARYRCFSAACVFALGAAVSCAGPAAAALTAADTRTVERVERAPSTLVDFSLPPWSSAQVLDGFETLTTRTPAKYATTARILSDSHAIYIAIHCEQHGLPLTATQTTNNVGFGLDDFAGIGIDTSGNGETYYFLTTPGGVRYQTSVESARYTPDWTSVARGADGSWDAFLVVPYSILRTSSGPQNWRFNVVRHIAAINENLTLAYDPLMNDQGFPQAGDARFWPHLRGVVIAGHAQRPKPRAEIYALGSAGGDRNVYQQAAGNFQPQGTRNLGLDLNVPLTGTIAFVGALSPDFSNVEIDQQTISPQEFRRGLQEYRPFFAQGAQFFTPAFQNAINSFPNEIFYTPSIGPFERGAKIEGGYGLQQIGALAVQGDGFSDEAFGFKHALPDRTFQYSFDAVDAHHADGNATEYSNAADDLTWDASAGGRNLHTGLVYGVDYGAERDPIRNIGQSLGYKTEDFLDVHKSNFEIYTSYRDIGPHWNPIDGFTNVADIRGPSMFVDLNGTPPATSPLKRIEFFVFADRLVDRSGAAHQSDFSANLDLIFRNQIHLNFGPNSSALRLYENGLDLVGYDVGYKNGVTVPFNQHNFNLGYKDGTPTPYDASFVWGPFTTFNADGTVRPTYLRQYTFSTSRPLSKTMSLGLEYDGTLEDFATADPRRIATDGQTLRRISFGQALGADGNFSVALRSISGTGGFAAPGLNLAASLHERFHNGTELFVNYGTPAANSTLQRVIVKYLVRLGSGAGT